MIPSKLCEKIASLVNENEDITMIQFKEIKPVQWLHVRYVQNYGNKKEDFNCSFIIVHKTNVRNKLNELVRIKFKKLAEKHVTGVSEKLKTNILLN